MAQDTGGEDGGWKIPGRRNQGNSFQQIVVSSGRLNRADTMKIEKQLLNLAVMPLLTLIQEMYTVKWGKMLNFSS